jgi:hypothetical protein
MEIMKSYYEKKLAQKEEELNNFQKKFQPLQEAYDKSLLGAIFIV